MNATAPQSKRLTREELADGINQVKRAINLWEASEQPRTDWRGTSTKCLSELVINAVDDLIDLVATFDAQERIKKTILAIDNFQRAMEQWALDCQSVPDQTDPRGSDEMWSAWREVIAKFSEKVRVRPDRIEVYDQQNLSDRQIALMYYWKDEADEPDVARVVREREKPGSEFDPETWVHPFDLADHEAIEKLWISRQFKTESRQAESGVRPEAPETIYELLQQRVPSEQILRMKQGSTYEGIRNVAIAHKLPIDGALIPVDDDESAATTDGQSAVQSPATGTADPSQTGQQQLTGQEPVDDSNSLASIPPEVYSDDHEKGGFLASSIAELEGLGKSPADIVEAFKEDFPELTIDHVGQIQSALAAQAVAGL